MAALSFTQELTKWLVRPNIQFVKAHKISDMYLQTLRQTKSIEFEREITLADLVFEGT